MSGVDNRIVADDDDGIRLDRWFKRHYPELKHGQLQKLLRTGQVRLDGGRAKSGDRVAAGQEIRVPPFQAAPKQGKQDKDEVSDEDAAFIRSLVIYEDEDVIALNKPPGIAVQGGSKITRHIDGMLGALTGKNKEKPKLVHRLDRDTSGVMILAKSANAAAALGKSFKHRTARKYYWAITVPAPDIDEGVIDVPLEKNTGAKHELVRQDIKDGKPAVTNYAVLEKVGKRAAWVVFWPRTGRTHQLRVHALLMGCPIMGDGKYGGKAAFLDGTEDAIAQKLHLHARRLVLPHPSGAKGRMIDVTAPLPDAFADTWRYFGFDVNDTRDPFADVD